MGKRKFILTASVIFVIGFGYCLYSTAKNKIPEEIPMEELIRHSGTESIVTEHHYFTSDPDEFPYEEVRNLPEEQINQRAVSTEEDYTEAHFFIPD